MMPDVFWKILTATLATGSILLGIGRYVGNIEARINQLETQQRYLHGSFVVPHGERP